MELLEKIGCQGFLDREALKKIKLVGEDLLYLENAQDFTELGLNLPRYRLQRMVTKLQELKLNGVADELLPTMSLLNLTQTPSGMKVKIEGNDIRSSHCKPNSLFDDDLSELMSISDSELEPDDDEVIILRRPPRKWEEKITQIELETCKTDVDSRGKESIYKRFDDGLYEGQMVDGKRHGKGFMHFFNGNSYDGNWAEDQIDGFGIMYYLGGHRYEGMWCQGKYHDQGKLIFANNLMYEGFWMSYQLNCS